MKKIINTQNAPQAIGPYSQAIEVNGMIFISGQIPINPETNQIEEGIENQTHRVMKNLKAILEEAKYFFSDVVKTTIFLKNMDDFSVANDIYAQYFETSYPARETVEVARLPKDVSVEISLIAVKSK